ncbi:MAG: CBS domain-containing protein [bacterium]|nr:CBS domain-containing protein [bacterium]
MGLNENLKSEPVSQLACREAVTIEGERSVREAVQAMRAGNLGCAILVDQDRKPVGIFTESKLTQLLANRPEALEEPVSQHADANCPTVSMDDPIASVLSALQTRNTRFLCVVDQDGQVVKLTGQKGLMEFIADHFPDQVAVQRLGQKPYMQEREGA